MIFSDRDMAGVVRTILNLKPGDSLDLIPLSKRGSERNFFRALVNSKTGGKPVIVVNYSPGREENNYYAGLARFLKGIGVAVPEIIADDETRHIIIMQDLGSADLWSFRNNPWEERRGLYSKSLDVICRLHSFSAGVADLKMMPGFGPELYRWSGTISGKILLKATAACRSARRNHINWKMNWRAWPDGSVPHAIL